MNKEHVVFCRYCSYGCLVEGRVYCANEESRYYTKERHAMIACEKGINIDGLIYGGTMDRFGHTVSKMENVSR